MAMGCHGDLTTEEFGHKDMVVLGDKMRHGPDLTRKMVGSSQKLRGFTDNNGISSTSMRIQSQKYGDRGYPSPFIHEKVGKDISEGQ